MNKNRHLERLKLSLEDNIATWLDKQGDIDDWQKLSIYVGDDISQHMTNAAMSVIYGVVSIQDFLKENELMEDD